MLNMTNCAHRDPEYETTTLKFDSPDEYDKNIANIQDAFDIPTTPTPFVCYTFVCFLVFHGSKTEPLDLLR